MGQFSFNIPNDFLGDLLKCKDNDDIYKEMLEEAAPVLVESMKKQLSNHKDSGELIKSIKAKSPKISKYGYWQIFVCPTGYSSKHYYGGSKKNRKYKLSNAAKAIFIQYGTPKQKANPFIETSTKNAEKDAIEKMQQVFAKKVGAQ